MDLSIVAISIDLLGRPMTLKRKSGGTYDDNGEWTGETIVPESIKAVYQPADGEKLLDMPEGERAETKGLLWTRSALARDDLIEYGGSQYRVLYRWPRPEGGFVKVALGQVT